jgi:cytochrome d ubiquinol oxidase subunit II
MLDAASIVFFYLAASLVLYAVLGGADFGAGILELFPPRGRESDQQRLVAHAMGPVWEANHVWLIIAVVILMMGYPVAFQLVSVTFHIPLTLLLVGITLRGCAFTFRSYDAFKEPRGQALYSRVFQASSLLTPLVLGMIAGGLTLGRIADPPAADFHGRFIAPWLNAFCLAVGVFVTTLFAFVAAVFLVGESDDPELRRAYRRRALAANAAAVVAGAVVFAGAAASGFDLLGRFAAEPRALAAMALATLLLAPLHWLLRKDAPAIAARALAGAVFSCVLYGWYALHAPALIVTTTPPGLTLAGAAAPSQTLAWLAGALLAGSVLMLPALAYLLYVFKFSRDSRPR